MYLEEVKQLLAEILHIHDQVNSYTADTPLLGYIPELDSMAVVSLITGIEEKYDITVEDDEISADAFETVGNLAAFIERKVS